MPPKNFTQKLILVIILTIITGTLNAQDIIKRCNEEEIKAIVLEVGNYDVTYKLVDDPYSEAKILKKNLIYSIQFANGEKEMFYCKETTEQKQTEPDAEKLSSPDLILLTNGEQVEGFVIEIGDTDVRYKKAGNPNGPSYTMKQASIYKIKYANGMEETFTQVSTQPVYETTQPVTETTQPEDTSVANTTEPIREETAENNYDEKKPSKKNKSETEENSNPNKFRFYVGAGFGNSYGMLGTNLEFRFSHFAFHGGVGWYPLAGEDITFAWSAGLKGYIWKNLYINAVVGTVGHYEEHRYYYSGNETYYKSYYEPILGISPMVGYQWAWGNGVRFGLNVGGGISIGFVKKPLITGSIVAPALDLGISISFGTKKYQ